MLTLADLNVLKYFVIFFVAYLFIKYIDLCIKSGTVLIKEKDKKIWNDISQFISIYLIISIGTYLLPVLLICYNVSEVVYHLILYLSTTLVLVLFIRRKNS